MPTTRESIHARALTLLERRIPDGVRVVAGALADAHDELEREAREAAAPVVPPPTNTEKKCLLEECEVCGGVGWGPMGRPPGPRNPPHSSHSASCYTCRGRCQSAARCPAHVKGWGGAWIKCPDCIAAAAESRVPAAEPR